MNRVLEWVLALVLIGAVMAFGGVQPLVYSLAELILFLLLFLLLLKQAREGKIDLPLPVWPVLFAALVALQAVALPYRVVVGLSPARLLDFAIRDLSQGKGISTTLSVYPHDTWLALISFLAYLSAFVLAAHVFDSRRDSSVLLRALILIGCCEAAYGIFQYLTGYQKIFGYVKEYNLEAATGTYINPNHFAGLLELTLPFAMASAFYSFQLSTEDRHTRGRRRPSPEQLAARYQSLFYLLLSVIMAVAVFFSRSRGGILTTLLTLAFVAVLAQFKARRKLWMVGIALFFACVVGLELWIGVNPVLARFDQGASSLRMEGRVALWKDEVRQIRDFPLVGTGLGTFAVVFRQYQTTVVDSHVDHAHNDYLEFASDTGLLGAAALFLPILYLFLRMNASFLEDPQRYRRAVTLGCIGSTLAMLLHSMVDFNLQIPANALIFSTVLGIGYKAACVERKGEHEATMEPARVAKLHLTRL